MENKKKKSKIVIIVLVVAIILLAGGITLSYLTSAKYVAKKAVKLMSENAVELANSGKTETGLEENFNTTSTIKVNLQSDYFQALQALSPDYQILSNILRNLSGVETQVTTIQDQKNKKMLVNFDSKLAGEELASVKYLVDNATEYYFINGTTENYINNGNNGYFEALSSATTTQENTEYIIKKIGTSAANNIKDEYLSESYEDGNKKVTITLTEDNMVEFFNNIIDELKEDSRANKIMTGYDKDFGKEKITKDDLHNIGTVTMNIYIDKFFGTVKKYEMTTSGNSGITYYEEENKILELRMNNELIAKLDITTTDDKIDAKITDGNGASIGSLSISKTSTNYDVIANITTSTLTANFGYNSQITNLKKGNSYDSSTTVSLDVSANNVSLINGTIEVTSTTTSDTTINEDVSNSVLASTMTTSPTELIFQKVMEVMNRLAV